MKTGPAIALTIFLIGLALFAAFVFFTAHRSDPLDAARKSGDPARIVKVLARIDRLEDTGSRHNHNPVISVHLSYADAQGKSWQTRVERAVPPLLLAQLAVGKRVMLGYDAADPAKADLLEPIEPREP